jgi:hypothetical protein
MISFPFLVRQINIVYQFPDTTKPDQGKICYKWNQLADLGKEIRYMEIFMDLQARNRIVHGLTKISTQIIDDVH